MQVGHIIHDFVSECKEGVPSPLTGGVSLQGSQTPAGKGKLDLPKGSGTDPSRRTPEGAMLKAQKGVASGGLSGSLTGTLCGGCVPRPLRATLGPACCCPPCPAWCSPPGQGLRMGHCLDSDSTWQMAGSSRPARPASRARVSRPQAEPQVFPLCVQGLQLPQGPSSHSSVRWRDRQTDGVSRQ